MPKKFQGANSHAVEARDRDQAKKKEAQAKAIKDKEDKEWEDSDKLINRKMQRKDEREAKHTEKLERKKENKELADRDLEEAASSSKSTKNKKPSRVTHAEISSTHAAMQAEMEKLMRESKARASKITEVDHLIENPNRIQLDGENARTVEEALEILEGEGPTDRHVEKRVKAAYLTYEEKRMPQLRKENPNFKFSKLKQMLWDEFQKSPENPKNQKFAAYNEKI
ncbi:hypothetical protein Ciccas_005770 [Cichlidogyrus casuarinus]|uniref:Coiled-coil domain-containing protein n=1 Tax=Cichlidogyrus casuarinus TaxID=1844966 RepID=A0ABD2Q8S5_9PLAT